MDKLEQIKKVLIQCGGIARTAEFVAAGISQITLGESCKNGDLKRIRQGFYQLADDDSLSEAQYLRALLP
ncbi:MAG: type IV toxin-antitoxin system AbiEi family antitoxin domain-containing protein, partial [Clostridia bacterium]|nr:type IV toxin-antitoxin system AbiEi family antitoxin domain-containing protein [Clostridia bacterium]